MTDHLAHLTATATRLVASGWYQVAQPVVRDGSVRSFRRALTNGERPAVVAELKRASPSAGPLASGADAGERARLYAAGGACGISVVVQPDEFRGRLEDLAEARTAGLPVLMKDFVVDVAQVAAAADGGADALLLIESIFRRGLVADPARTRDRLIREAHDRGLETLLEVATPEEFRTALVTEATVLGINNRDLATQTVDLTRTAAILADRRKDRPVLAMSGVAGRRDVEELLRAGADGVLVGESLMRSDDPVTLLRSLRGVP